MNTGTGAAATGGMNTGATSTGGTVTGGTAMGGSRVGGTVTGGAATGGIGMGSISTGGRAIGGTTTGGAATGGGAIGGTGPVSVCQTVTTLPTQYSQCSNQGESRCLASGGRCVCARNVWYCNTECARIAQPNPDGDCSTHRGAACTNAGGLDCACVANRWICLGNSSICPADDTITTGDGCPGQVGVACDYPDLNSDPLNHKVCACLPPEAEAGYLIPTWTCFLSNRCPATQPVYPTACNVASLCAYGNVHCACLQGGNWICLPL